MKRIYVTSLHRVPDPNEEGDLGKLYIIDWEDKQLRHKPLATESITIGRSRGIRGITWHNGKLVVAGVTNNISVYNPDTLELENSFPNGDAKYLHQIRSHNGMLHMASTGNDVVVRAPLYGCDSIAELRDIIDPYITHPNACPWGGDRLHFNSLAWDENGDEYHVYNAASMIFNFTKKEVFCHSRAFHALHDLVITPTHMITNSSGDRATLSIDRKTKDISVIHKSRRHPTYSTNLHGMTRGLAAHGNHLFIGITPGDIALYYKWKDQYEFVSNFSLSIDPRESIFDILLDPRDWTE